VPLPTYVVPDDKKLEVKLTEWEQVKKLSGGQWVSRQQRAFFKELLASQTLDTETALAEVNADRRWSKKLTVPEVDAWLANPALMGYLEGLLEQRIRTLGIDVPTLELHLERIMAMALGDEPIKKMAFYRGDMVQHEGHDTNLSAATKVAEVVGKMRGVFKEDLVDTPAISINFDLGGGQVQSINTQPVENKPPIEAAPDLPRMTGAELVESAVESMDEDDAEAWLAKNLGI
jgi:hypothetical protein